jgi:uroporphyrin-III C-methyltransferase/precorrin-2 dehydrogenase/sirohydrochlorin ferrochelatase
MYSVPRRPAEQPAGRMGPLARLPVFYTLEGKRVLIAGGNAQAAWKAELMSAAGARVELYAGDICEELRQLIANPPRERLDTRRF